MRKSWVGYAAVLAVVGGVAVASTAGAHSRSAKPRCGTRPGKRSVS